ncbi:MAG TPA: 2-oxoacid:acceptor oxidoreductase subunit alpha [Anaerolineaceae bacterium]|nr:2-oxoacid:acceptor oxidoreductase subunit alpha [Chloroflexota bacterium]HOF28680.1 2-oxoacid:acceptor oxidoreductase subunit alpha [Anaerolineaceae bacterium]
MILDTTQKSPHGSERIVNEVCMTICTINGSGSATANNILYRALFRMGIMTSGKNVFPSNIKGLPTWFVIRASARGYTGRIAHDDVVIAMNQVTIQKDIDYLKDGGVLFYADHLELPQIEKDIIVYPMPIKALMKTVDAPRNMTNYLENMLYVGIVGQVMGIPENVLKATIDHQFSGKPAIAESNFNIVNLGYQYALKNIEKKDRFYLEQLPELSDYILTDGNNAGALGALYGGLQFCAWYPITPATSLVESAIGQVGKLRKDPKTGKNTCVILQVEDELAAAGATLGAGWAGLRAMTSTSGPGISLMTENIGLAYFTETPMVIWDVQRVGPSTGLPTRTAQGDLSMLYTLGHGDTKHVILIPGTVTECFEFGWRSLDIAEKYQTPIFVLSDLDLGMNTWVTKRFEYPSQPIERGKIVWEDKLEEFKDWGRYKDLDGDGIPYRTVIGNQSPKAAYFTRGTGHDEYGNYSEDPQNWNKILRRIGLKLDGVVRDLPRPIIRRAKSDAEIGIIGMGSTHDAMIEAQDLLAEMGIQADYMRVRALPASIAVREFIASHARNYVVELNRDGQLKQILSLEISEYSEKLISISEIGGLPLTAAWTAESIYLKEKRNGKNR